MRGKGTLIARYAYDVAGRRIAKRVYSSATGGTVAYTRFVYHGSQVAFETDSVGTIGLRYTWGLEVDDLVGVCTAPCNTETNHYYVTVDQLRNVREVTRRDGTWLLSRRFGPYGAQIEEAGTVSFELRYRWTGREYDVETGFYFFRSRYYDVAARRFVQEDPIGYAGGRSLYQYGEGNPLNGRDPDGLRMNYEAYMLSPKTLEILSRGSGFGDDGSKGGSSYLAAWANFNMKAWLLGVPVSTYEYLLSQAEVLARTGAATVTVNGISVNFTFTSSEYGAAGRMLVSQNTLAEVLLAGARTQGVSSVGLMSGWRAEGYSSGTWNLHGDNQWVETHSLGLAVDIGSVNGEGVRSHTDAALLTSLMSNLRALPGAAEVYGPGFAWNRPGGWATWQWSAGSGASHQGGIHYSSYSWWR